MNYKVGNWHEVKFKQRQEALKALEKAKELERIKKLKKCK